MQRLQVRLHHIRDSAHLRGFPQLIHRSLFLSIALAECLKGHINADLVAELETVRDCLGRGEHSNGPAPDAVLLDSKVKPLSGKAHDPHCRASNPGSPCLPVERDPHLEGSLSSDFMKTERREKADDGLRNSVAHLQQAD